LQQLARGCKNLIDITLNDCGNAIDSDAMKSFATYCKNMKYVAVSRCPNIYGNAVKWIATMPCLERLEMSGCRNLTDVCILPISEADKCPNLTTLSLTKNENITDTALAWIANGCADQLMTFSFKGSAITKASARAVRDMFAYCDMIFDEKQSGFFPKPRVSDRKLMNHYYILQQGFTKLQARVRRWGGARRALWQRGVARRNWASQAIIDFFRHIIAVKRLNQKRLAWKKRNRHAEIVTSFFWMVRGMSIVRRMKKQLYLDYVREQAECIQRTWRLYWKKSRWFLLKKEFLEWVRLYVNSAIAIQSIARMRQGVVKAHRVHAMKQGRHKVEERKARFLQRIYRGYRGRTRAWLIKAELQDINFQQNRASRRISYNLRRWRLLSLLESRYREKVKIQASAIAIQSIIRGRIGRMLVMEIQADRREIAEEWGALKIQTRWRVVKASLRVQRIREAYYKRLAKQDKAASVIANAQRGRVARIEMAQRMADKKNAVTLKVQARIWGATTIQSTYRGYKGRNRFNALIRERKGKWKELFDEDKKRRFFYNKLTGEIRWRMPQDLLDLIPRPQCDNCQFYEAALECVVCNEVYCMQCFDQVHFGGRRKDHEFRSLYDFYGKRLDYGDGVFPSKWPSEVIQDDVQGWMLRVAPIRDPIEQWGTWEVYSDRDNVAKPADGKSTSPGKDAPPPPAEIRTFFFNRDTFEATYVEPDIVRDLKAEKLHKLQYEEASFQYDQKKVQALDEYVHYSQNNITNNSSSRPNTGYYDSNGQYMSWDPSRYV